MEVNQGPRKRWSSRRTLAGNSCFWSEGWSACARYRHRCRTWAHNLCLESTVHPRAEQHRGFTLIPVSSVGEAVGGVNEAVRDEKVGGNGVEGTFSTKTWPMMEWLLRHTNKSPSPWPKRATTSGVRACTARKSARVCVRRGVLCTPIVTFMEVATVWTLNCQKIWEVRKTKNGGRI